MVISTLASLVYMLFINLVETNNMMFNFVHVFIFSIYFMKLEMIVIWFNIFLYISCVLNLINMCLGLLSHLCHL